MAPPVRRQGAALGVADEGQRPALLGGHHVELGRGGHARRHVTHRLCNNPVKLGKTSTRQRTRPPLQTIPSLKRKQIDGS